MPVRKYGESYVKRTIFSYYCLVFSFQNVQGCTSGERVAMLSRALLRACPNCSCSWPGLSVFLFPLSVLSLGFNHLLERFKLHHDDRRFSWPEQEHDFPLAEGLFYPCRKCFPFLHFNPRRLHDQPGAWFKLLAWFWLVRFIPRFSLFLCADSVFTMLALVA